MKNNKQFSTAISNQEHLARAKKTYTQKVLPFIDENRKAYKLYVQEKLSLELTPSQKAHLRYQSTLMNK